MWSPSSSRRQTSAGSDEDEDLSPPLHHRPQQHPQYHPRYSGGSSNDGGYPSPEQQQQQRHHASYLNQHQPGGEDDDPSDDDDDDDEARAELAEVASDSDEEVEEEVTATVQHPHHHHHRPAPRGKPEAMAVLLAAKHAAANRQELEENEDEDEDLDDEDDLEEDDEVEAEAVVEAEPVVVSAAAAAPVVAVAAAKPVSTATSKAKKGASAPSKNMRSPAPKSTSSNAISSSKKTKKKKEKSSPPSSSSTPHHSSSSPASSSNKQQLQPKRTELLLGERVPPVKPAEWENIEALMFLFCKVPLLAEFSRPVSLLHPELMSGYSKIVSHPVDLGHVCRGIRRRQYRCLRDIRLDMWRVFANCVKFHSHPHNKEAVPSFVSIALHLREYFNMLWQEYMLPSEVPEDATELTRLAFKKRSDDRKRRIENSGVLVMTKRYIIKTAQLMLEFLERGGRVDGLDTDPIFAESALAKNADLAVVYRNLKEFAERLADPAQAPDEYCLEEYYRDMRSCYEDDMLEDQPSLLNRISNRLERLFWKRTVPLHEGNTRGVGQSSIWGNVAATIWARENSKKPYWPALCLGILPPKDQREGWHAAVTERNESRLPEKLRVQLVAAKKKCEQFQKRQNLSYFLVEFLGTHEFIWVRELDIIEKFDPENDPNKTSNAASKKKRSSRSDTASVTKSKAFLAALEECKWAQDEFENVLQDALDDEQVQEHDDDDEEMNYSYAILAQSDDEADDEDMHGCHYDVDDMSDSDAEEANYLLTHDGMIDISSIGAKKKAKKKAPIVKSKKSVEKEKKESAEAQRKAKAEQLKKKKFKEKEDRKELRELEKRRRKRTREREKALKEGTRKLKRRRMSYDSDEGEPGLAWDKRARATAIVKAYLMRTLNKNEEYKSLALNGVLSMPSAMVDPTGLLGMTLAFRAAAGVLNMPDDSEEQITKTTKPWAAIDTTSAKTSAERTQKLEQQKKILEREIQRVRANTKMRRELAEEAIAQRHALDRRIEADDIAARFNHFKKKKKLSTKPSDSSSGKTLEITDNNEEGADDDDEAGSAVPTELDDDPSLEDRSGAVVVAEALREGEDDEDDDDGDDDAPVSEVVVTATAEDDE